MSDDMSDDNNTTSQDAEPEVPVLTPDKYATESYVPTNGYNKITTRLRKQKRRIDKNLKPRQHPR